MELSGDRDLAAWQRLQYGMFIHWGIFSELGGVWEGESVREGYSEQIQMWADISEEEYRQVAGRFRPDRLDPAAICSLAKQAGMRYVVITSKHHDGFSMFDTVEPSHEAWWQVDLGRGYDIDAVEIWNRTDCCTDRLSDYWVIASLAEALATPGVVAVHRPDTPGRPTTVDLDATARHVRVQLASTSDPLSLTEVVVRGR